MDYDSIGPHAQPCLQPFGTRHTYEGMEGTPSAWPSCLLYIFLIYPTKNTRVTIHIHSVHHNFEPLFAESMVSRASRPFWAWILFGWALDAIRSCRKERRQRKRRKLEASRPRLSQTHRSRSLSVGFSENQNIQSYSRLFTMLPLEIRLQIYECVLGRRTVHFRRPCCHTVPETVALQPYWCKVKGEKDHPVRPREDLTRDMYCEFGIPSYKHAPSPALLRTCRQMYDFRCIHFESW